MATTRLKLFFTATDVIDNADILVTVMTRTTDGNAANNSANSFLKINALPVVAAVVGSNEESGDSDSAGATGF